MTGQIPIRYVDPEQDARALQRIAHEAAWILAPGEEILFIAAEDTAATSVKRDSVVITTCRIIAFRPSEVGRVSFRDYPWQDILDVGMAEGMLSTEIVIDTPAGKRQVGWITRESAGRLCDVARQMAREWRERHRVYTGAPVSPSFGAAAPSEKD